MDFVVFVLIWVITSYLAVSWYRYNLILNPKNIMKIVKYSIDLFPLEWKELIDKETGVK